MVPELHCGCSGYYYPPWKGDFYPAKMAASKFLEYYSERLNSLELNSSFRMIPSEKTLERLYNDTPDNFAIVVKMHRMFTHFGKPGNQSQQIDEFQQRIQSYLKEKLHGFLFQFPPNFSATDQNLSEIRSLGKNDLNFIELRNRTWQESGNDELLVREGFQLVSVSFPNLEEKIYDQPRQYLRFHGIPKLFKSPYSETDIQRWIERIPSGSKVVYAFFNNTIDPVGAENALLFTELFHQTFTK